MRELIGAISINLLIVYASVGLSYVYFLNISGPKEKIGKIIIWLTPAIMVTFVMSNSFVLENGNSIDFRYLVLISACLYGGYFAGFPALLAIVFMSIIWIPEFLAITTTVSTILFIIAGSLHSRFANHDIKGKKKMMLIIFTLFPLVMSVSMFLEMEGNDIAYVLCFMLVNTLTSRWKVSYIAFLDNLIYLKDQITKLEKSQLVSEMAASITHEIRNPLTSTRGFLQLLREDDVKPEDKTLFVDVAIDGIDRANEVLTDYLSFAKPTNSEPVCINLVEEIPKTLNLIYPLAIKNNVEVEYYVGKGTLQVEGVPMKFRQCLLNVLKNAVESMPNGGKLNIQLIECENQVCVNVIDTGKGMNNQQLKKLGSAYFTTKEDGTGLGLMAVYHIVEKMRGKVRVNSSPGAGTKFSLYFPEFMTNDIKEYSHI